MTKPHSLNLNEQSQPEEKPLCPVGEADCAVIDQVVALRDEVTQLVEQVQTDLLTGLYNFRHFRACLAQEMERTRRTENPTALIIVDLDFFKQVNDNWGHEAGNQALIIAAKALRSTTRGLDVVCRYGGEEFAIILPATELMIALQVAERVRKAIEAHPVIVEAGTIELTASLGVDLYTFKQDDTPEQFVARTDQHLYQAKQEGRNCVRHGIAEVGKSEAAVSIEERDILTGLFTDNNDD